MKRHFLLFFILLTGVGCKKEQVELIPFKKIDTGLQGNLYVLARLNNHKILAAGGHAGNGRVLISEDNGNSWQLLAGETEGAITALAIADSLTWYAGTSTAFAYKTQDGGTHWEKLWVNTPYPPQYRKPVRRIAKTDNSTFFFVLGGDFEAGGIWKTPDAGTTWKAHTFNFELRDMVFANPYTGVACGYGNMIMTTDGGETWTYSPCSNGYFMKLNYDENKKWWAVSFNGGVYSTASPAYGWSEKLNAAHVFSKRKNFYGLLWDEERLLLFGENGWLISGDEQGHWNASACCNNNPIRDLLVTGNHYTACGNNGEIYLIDRN
jgi:photosystem II stability/assembly factor-like uncharacterized protein